MMKKILLLLIPLLLASCATGKKEEQKEEIIPIQLSFSHDSGFYDEPFYLTIESSENVDIYYTVDNSEPNESSLHYEEPILIEDVSNKENIYSIKQHISSLDVYYPSSLVDKCTIVKVIGINKETKEKTPISYLDYFVGYQNKSGYNNMPIITLNVNDDDLFDYEKGIYVTGKIYDKSEHIGYPETYPANYNQKGKEWERPANFKYFDEDGKIYLQQNIGVRIHGGWSRAFNQKSFNLYAREQYDGNTTFTQSFFDDIKPHSLMLRSGGYRDTFVTKIRDSLNQDFSVNEKFDVQKSSPTIVFLNGEYWGIYNLQERYSDYYVQEHHDIDRNNVLIIKNDEIDEGRRGDFHLYQELKNFFTFNDFSSYEEYKLAKEYIDMEEFASYMAVQLYVGNIDWPGNNVRLYRDVSRDSQWHFMMFDTDDSINMVSHMCAANVDPFLKTSHWKSGPLESDCLLGLMFTKLLLNNEFKTIFRNTILRIGRDTFSTEKVNTYLQNKKNLLSEPMANNYHRFVNDEYDETTFLDYVDGIKDFFAMRYSYIEEYLNEHIPA